MFPICFIFVKNFQKILFTENKSGKSIDKSEFFAKFLLKRNRKMLITTYRFLDLLILYAKKYCYGKFKEIFLEFAIDYFTYMSVKALIRI